MSKRFRKQSHTIYECKYHLVFCPKYRYRVLTDEVREYTRESIEKLVKQKEELEILELNVQADHVHLLLWIPPKYSVASVMGYLKGNSPSEFCKGMRNWVRSIGAGICGAADIVSAR